MDEEAGPQAAGLKQRQHRLHIAAPAIIETQNHRAPAAGAATPPGVQIHDGDVARCLRVLQDPQVLEKSAATPVEPACPVAAFLDQAVQQQQDSAGWRRPGPRRCWNLF